MAVTSGMCPLAASRLLQFWTRLCEGPNWSLGGDPNQSNSLTITQAPWTWQGPLVPGRIKRLANLSLRRFREATSGNIEIRDFIWLMANFEERTCHKKFPLLTSTIHLVEESCWKVMLLSCLNKSLAMSLPNLRLQIWHFTLATNWPN